MPLRMKMLERVAPPVYAFFSQPFLAPFAQDAQCIETHLVSPVKEGACAVCCVLCVVCCVLCVCVLCCVVLCCVVLCCVVLCCVVLCCVVLCVCLCSCVVSKRAGETRKGQFQVTSCAEWRVCAPSSSHTPFLLPHHTSCPIPLHTLLLFPFPPPIPPPTSAHHTAQLFTFPSCPASPHTRRATSPPLMLQRPPLPPPSHRTQQTPRPQWQQLQERLPAHPTPRSSTTQRPQPRRRSRRTFWPPLARLSHAPCPLPRIWIRRCRSRCSSLRAWVTRTGRRTRRWRARARCWPPHWAASRQRRTAASPQPCACWATRT